MSYPIVLLTGQARAGKDTAAAVICEALGGQSIALADPMKRFMMDAFGLTVAQLWGDQKEVEFELSREDEYGHRRSVVHYAGALRKALSPIDKYIRDLIDPIVSWADGLPIKTTPRYILQTFGTECIRSVRPNFWIEYGIDLADRMLSEQHEYSSALGLRDEIKRTNCVVITDGRFRNEVLRVQRRAGVCVRIRRGAMGSIGLAEDAAKHSSETEQTAIPDFWFDRHVLNDQGLEEFRDRVKQLAVSKLFQFSAWYN